MLYFSADPRDGGPAGASCQACCCQTFSLRPGERNLVVINYAPWSMAIQPPGIVAAMDYTVDVNNTACFDSEVDGFAFPSNTQYTLTTPVSTNLAIDLSVNEGPVGNTFVYQIVPMAGPKNGVIVQTGTPGDPTFLYMPNGGFTGYDYFAYKMIDGQGRHIIRMVQVSIGVHNNLPDLSLMATKPFIDRSRVTTNCKTQEVRFPIYMPLSVRDCSRFRLTIQQPAMDCDRSLYHHISCFDIIPKDCL